VTTLAIPAARKMAANLAGEIRRVIGVLRVFDNGVVTVRPMNTAASKRDPLDPERFFGNLWTCIWRFDEISLAPNARALRALRPRLIECQISSRLLDAADEIVEVRLPYMGIGLRDEYALAVVRHLVDLAKEAADLEQILAVPQQFDFPSRLVRLGRGDD
jgi:hypothetical protein